MNGVSDRSTASPDTSPKKNRLYVTAFAATVSTLPQSGAVYTLGVTLPKATPNPYRAYHLPRR